MRVKDSKEQDRDYRTGEERRRHVTVQEQRKREREREREERDSVVDPEAKKHSRYQIKLIARTSFVAQSQPAHL